MSRCCCLPVPYNVVTDTDSSSARKNVKGEQAPGTLQRVAIQHHLQAHQQSGVNL